MYYINMFKYFNPTSKKIEHDETSLINIILISLHTLNQSCPTYSDALLPPLPALLRLVSHQRQ
jgi:hypothetical protein